MATDPRVALAAFVAALERHFEVVAARRGEQDPAVEAAYQSLAEAFDEYDRALMDTYSEVTPFEIYDDEDDDDLDDDDVEDAEIEELDDELDDLDD